MACKPALTWPWLKAAENGDKILRDSLDRRAFRSPFGHHGNKRFSGPQLRFDFTFPLAFPHLTPPWTCPLLPPVEGEGKAEARGSGVCALPCGLPVSVYPACKCHCYHERVGVAFLGLPAGVWTGRWTPADREASRGRPAWALPGPRVQTTLRSILHKERCPER